MMLQSLVIHHYFPLTVLFYRPYFAERVNPVRKIHLSGMILLHLIIFLDSATAFSPF